jgi:hypothetical protein
VSRLWSVRRRPFCEGAVTVDGCTFSGNVATCGGIFTRGRSRCTTSAFYGNGDVATFQGGALMVDTETYTISHRTITPTPRCSPAASAMASVISSRLSQSKIAGVVRVRAPRPPSGLAEVRQHQTVDDHGRDIAAGRSEIRIASNGGLVRGG